MFKALVCAALLGVASAAGALELEEGGEGGDGAARTRRKVWVARKGANSFVLAKSGAGARLLPSPTRPSAP